MAEQLQSPQPENFNPYAQALQDSQRKAHEMGPQEQRYHEWLGDSVDQQSAADLATYLESRPYKDKHTNDLFAPNGERVNHNEYFDDVRDAYETQSMPKTTQEVMKDKSMSEVARALGQAELNNDTETSNDLADILVEKIDEFSKKQVSKGHPEGLGSEAQGKLLERMLKVRDKFKAGIAESTSDEAAAETAGTTTTEAKPDTDSKTDGKVEPESARGKSTEVVVGPTPGTTPLNPVELPFAPAFVGPVPVPVWGSEAAPIEAHATSTPDRAPKAKPEATATNAVEPKALTGETSALTTDQLLAKADESYQALLNQSKARIAGEAQLSSHEFLDLVDTLFNDSETAAASAGLKQGDPEYSKMLKRVVDLVDQQAAALNRQNSRIAYDKRKPERDARTAQAKLEGMPNSMPEWRWAKLTPSERQELLAFGEKVKEVYASPWQWFNRPEKVNSKPVTSKRPAEAAPVTLAETSNIRFERLDDRRKAVVNNLTKHGRVVKRLVSTSVVTPVANNVKSRTQARTPVTASRPLSPATRFIPLRSRVPVGNTPEEIQSDQDDEARISA